MAQGGPIGNFQRLASRTSGQRHSILDLAPLELECMSALWPMGEGTVRDIHGRLAATCPRAYTTVLTIMDRLAHKGIVTRRKVGRAFRYQPSLSADEARAKAVEKIVAGFFDGSSEALAVHLASRREAAQNAPGVARSEVDTANAAGTDSNSSNLDTKFP